MGLTSLQVCMDSSDWFQGTVQEENGMMDSSLSSPSEDILTCSRPLIERRLRPPHDQALKCPRCDSTHTKFCYYNNYSLSQPRYFCKSCRRYWTKGGTLRNIPVGGGCRKNKKVSSKKSSNDNPGSSFSSSQHSFPDSHFSRLASLSQYQNPNIIMETKYNNIMVENPVPIDFMESKYEEALVGNGELGMNFHGSLANGFSFPGLCSSSPFGMAAMDMNNGIIPMEAYHHQRLMLPYENQENYQNALDNDVKPNSKLLSLEWHDQACNSDAGKDTVGYQLGGLGSSWTGLMNGYGSTATNPLL